MYSAFCMDATDFGKMRRQGSRASEVVQNTSFIGGADVDDVIPSHIACKSPLLISYRSWFVSALDQIPREVVDICLRPRRFCTGPCELLGFPFANCRFFFHSRYSFGAIKRLLVSSIDRGSGAWVRPEIRAMRTERSKSKFEAGIKGRFETDDASQNKKLASWQGEI